MSISPSMRVALFAASFVPACLLLLAGAAFTLARITESTDRRGILLTAVTPVGFPALLLALIGFLVALRIGRTRALWVPVVPTVLGLIVQLVWLAPAYLGDHPEGPADLTVMQLNMRYGLADAAATTALARRTGADVVALEEITPEALAALRAHGLTRRLPHHAGAPTPGRDGLEVLSRYPLTQVRRLHVTTGGFLMRVGAPTPFWLIAAHADQPFGEPERWARDLATLRRTAARLRGPRMVVGDLNATLDHAPVRRVLDTGLAGAAQEANSGWQPTWPGAVGGGGVFGWAGVAQIDHVLVGGGIGAVSTSTSLIPGSDHRALVARLVLGR